MKDIHTWLDEHADLVTDPLTEGSRKWVTKARGDYITLEGMEDKYGDFLPKLIFVSSTWEQGKPINIGFNPDEQKWYGWSHRAYYGFGVGSECKRGHIHYRPVDKDDFLQDMIRFWSDDDHINVTGEHRDDGVYIKWERSQSIENQKLRGTITGNLSHYPSEYGRGEWIARTLFDARQMAVDFANNIA